MPETVLPDPSTTLTPQGPAANVPQAVPAASDTPAQNETVPEAGAEKEAAKPEAKTTEDPTEQRGKNRYERRLDRAYRREAEARAKNELLERRLAELESRIAPKESQYEGEPQIEQFDDVEKYVTAKAEFRAKKALEAHQARQRSDQAKASQSQLLNTWKERVEEASDKYDDWDDVVGELEPKAPMTIALMSATNGHDVAYHLGKHMKEASRIAGLNPIAQMLEIGRLSAKLEADPPKPKQPSKAPPPITPLSGNESPPSTEHDPNDDMKTFIKKRNRELGRVALK